MDVISARDVIEAAERMLARPREGLAVDSCDITGSFSTESRRRTSDRPG